MPVLKTMKGDIKYTTHPLFLGIKKIDRIIARENLLLFKSIVREHHISFGLIAGTLLGAIREHDFIEHDEDIDLFLLEEEKQRFFCILPQLMAEGFKIARYDRRGLLSIIRKGEYIDLYFFSPFKEKVRACSGWCIPEHFLIEIIPMFFHGSEFMIPKDSLAYLEYEYGENWRTPIPYTDFKISRWKVKLFEIKEKLKEFLPDWAYFFLAHSSEVKMMKRYQKRISQYLG